MVLTPVRMEILSLDGDVSLMAGLNLRCDHTPTAPWLDWAACPRCVTSAPFSSHLFLGWKSSNSKDTSGTGAVNAFKIYYTALQIYYTWFCKWDSSRSPKQASVRPVQCSASFFASFSARWVFSHRGNSIFSNMKWAVDFKFSVIGTSFETKSIPKP